MLHPTSVRKTTSLVLAAAAPLFGAVSAASAQTRVTFEHTQIGTAGQDEASDVMPWHLSQILFSGLSDRDLSGNGLHQGGYDVIIGTFDATTSEVTIDQWGTPQHESAHALCPGSNGDVWIGGGSNGPLGGPGAGGFDAWGAKTDGIGSRYFTVQQGTRFTDDVTDVAADQNGGVFITGATQGSLAGPSAGGWDGFLTHLDEDGTLLEEEQFGTSGTDNLWSVDTDLSGGLFMGGDTTGNLGGPSSGGRDAVIYTFDPTVPGGWLVAQEGTTSNDSFTSVAADDEGGCWAAGSTGGSLFAPSSGGDDIILAHYDRDGNRTQAIQFGSSGVDHATQIISDGNGGIIMVGDTSANLSGPSNGGIDSFIAIFDKDGNRVRLDQFGSAGNDRAHSVATQGEAPGGAIVIVGSTTGSLGGPAQGGDDIFITTYSITCYADCDTSTGNGVLDVFDFLCFQNSFVNAEPYACDCDTSTGVGVCDVFDFLCFQNAFVGGCP